MMFQKIRTLGALIVSNAPQLLALALFIVGLASAGMRVNPLSAQIPLVQGHQPLFHTNPFGGWGMGP